MKKKLKLNNIKNVYSLIKKKKNVKSCKELSKFAYFCKKKCLKT
jgi:uncharacterized protein YfkK (UPF0435 family)